MLDSLYKMRGMLVTPARGEENLPMNNQSLPHLPSKEESMTNTTADSNNANVFTYLSMTAISMIIVTGVTGNLLVFLAVKTSKKLQTISNVFIVNLSSVNLLFVVGVLPFHIYTNLNKQTGLSPTLCKIIGFVDYTLTGNAIMTITLIAYNRYRLIGDYQQYRKYFNPIRVGFMLAVAWILPMLCLLPPLLEVWGKFGYVDQLSTCNLHEDDKYFKDILLILRTLMPILLIIYYYMCICRTSKASHSRITKPAMAIPSKRDSLNSQRVRNERHMTKMMLTIICVFILSYFPCTITALIDLHYPLAKSYHLFCRLCIYFSSAVNPVIYGLMNTQFNQAYKNLMRIKKQGSIKQKTNIQKMIKMTTLSLKPVIQLQNTNISQQFRKLSNVNLAADKIDLLES